ncbi:hypothetical protein [Enterococcus sp. DIV1314a]|uniref:hypothetical protein n=1 Tax=Enterococcus sp. DIV1314a TaxID=2774660 RepID=UPI003F285C82
MKDDEIAKLILKEIEIYLQFDLMKCEYAKNGIKNALKKIKKRPQNLGGFGEDVFYSR